ncbi:TPA: hypothetical protein ACH3X1_010126 [Trebouxia sp. C0004]
MISNQDLLMLAALAGAGVVLYYSRKEQVSATSLQTAQVAQAAAAAQAAASSISSCIRAGTILKISKKIQTVDSSHSPTMPLTVESMKPMTSPEVMWHVT